MKLLRTLLILEIVVYASCMPKSKTRTQIDQKQSGDYNIRLSLKDFQIIALLGDDTIGDIGNLDYNYDYSELTIKPTGTSTTTSIPSITVKPENATETTTVTSQSSTEQISLTTPVSITKKPVQEVPGIIPVFVEIPKKVANRRTLQPQSTLSTVENNNNKNDKTSNPSTEVVQIRKCPIGHARDKRGRCRKIRRPQFPFELARIASLAAKLSPTNEGNPETDSVQE